jgi:hypothetical protein
MAQKEKSLRKTCVYNGSWLGDRKADDFNLGEIRL